MSRSALTIAFVIAFCGSLAIAGAAPKRDPRNPQDTVPPTRPPVKRADLTIAQVHAERGVPQRITIRNLGNADAGRLDIQVSAYGFYGGLLYRLDMPRAERLAAGQQKTIHLYADGFSVRYYRILVDPQRRVAESNERNNQTTFGSTSPR